jgi:hypothetical protein
VFDPLDHPGLPVDRHGRHWHELDVSPVDARATDPYTRHRISAMEALETAAARFDRQLTWRTPDPDARRSVGSLGQSAAVRRRHVAALQPLAESAPETATWRERAALDLVTWVARSESDRDRSQAYRRQAWWHLDRLRSYAELADLAGFGWADRIVREVDDLWPASATHRPAPRRTDPDPRRTDPGPLAPAEQPMSLVHDWAVRAARARLAPPSGATTRPAGDSWDRLMVHECANCYLYYSFLTEESDRRVRPLWELHLQMELAHLRAVADLVRRHAGRDPREVVGSPLPEPVRWAANPLYLVDLPADESDDVRAEREDDLVDLLTGQHVRIDTLFQRVIRADGDDRHITFAELVRLLAVHEVVEEEVAHPLARQVDPDGSLAEHMLDEESQLSDALADAVRTGGNGEVTGLRDLVRAHTRDEERDEFARLRAAVPAGELRQMAAAARVAQAASTVDRESPDADGPALADTVDRVRDELHGQLR